MQADDFRTLERRRTQALVDRDLPLIERLHAPDYQLITPAGRVFSRARDLAAIAEAPFYAGWTHGAMQVRLAPGMALLRYPATITFPSGKVVRCWHTDSYEVIDGDWLAMWSQATPLPADADDPAQDA
ncbi:MAG TPA: nuclear transport factor 2 family protein [Aquabacterium sp.]|nr:nuclear transport factor 2 family protein [Aquabacterium sp.]HQC97755.1 nuclear transport factor 2 family protein [Aquabacterium sp.]